MPLPDSVVELVARFDSNRKEYHQAHYNETQTRIDFVNPLFQALGWDMDNHKALSEVQREVIHEDALKIGGTTKAPDYGFRAGGQRRFFLETKKPSVSLKLLAAPAYQLRRYAWTAKLPVSILTNFEEFAVYDGRVIPDHKDGPTIARLDYFKYTEMAERWDEIAGRFSYDAVLSGAFDRYAAEAPGRKSFIPVDAAFLARISEWRETLARNIVAHNPGVTPRELNYAVQMIIDRIIFLRISEDRGVETQYRLEPLQNGARVYPRLLELFRHADARYNSGLFHFDRETGRGEPDDITPRLTIDDRLLRDLLGGLYGDKNPYVFSIFPADILGQVYEQFLGQVIRVSGRTAAVEDKPEVKKAGGVYYTPTYIVRYIVEHTVGKLVDGKTPAQVARLTVLDPACGSGSFLIGAYQFLLDWHLKYYTDHDPAKLARGKKAVLYLAAKDAAGNDVWRLTTAEKKRILLANLYGVDIDTQAVEVTKLSLLLKVLESESGEVLNNTLKLYQERVLPDLESNIQCGNSLIGPDFYADKKFDDFDLDARLKINAFDWKTAFPKVMADGGFDAVIGNPPWGGDIDNHLDYYHAKFPNSTSDHTDSFKLFIEQANNLAATSGMISMIVPNTLLRQRRLRDVRLLILRQSLSSVVDLGEDVFKGVVAPSCIFVEQKEKPAEDQRVRMLDASRLSNVEKATTLGDDSHIVSQVSQQDFNKNTDGEFKPTARQHQVPVTMLGAFNDLECKDGGINYQRVKVGMTEKGKSDLSKRLLYEGRKLSASDHMYWKGTDIDRFYATDTTNRFCRTNYADFIEKNEVVHLNKAVYDTTPKILLRQTADKIIATLDYKGRWFGRSIIAVLPKQPVIYRMEYFLGLLNSRYMNSLYSELVAEVGRVFAQVKLSKLKQLPLRSIDFAKPAEKAKHDKMVSLVEQMLKLHKEKAGARLAQEKAVWQQQIEATDAQIDRLVYDLYGLTEEEIKIVEATG